MAWLWNEWVFFICLLFFGPSTQLDRSNWFERCANQIGTHISKALPAFFFAGFKHDKEIFKKRSDPDSGRHLKKPTSHGILTLPQKLVFCIQPPWKPLSRPPSLVVGWTTQMKYMIIKSLGFVSWLAAYFMTSPPDHAMPGQSKSGCISGINAATGGEGLTQLEVLGISGECMVTLNVSDSMCGRDLWNLILGEVPIKPGLQLVVSHSSRLCAEWKFETTRTWGSTGTGVGYLHSRQFACCPCVLPSEIAFRTKSSLWMGLQNW